jgi:hypothetical protein
MKYTREPFMAPVFLDGGKMISRKDAVRIVSRMVSINFWAWAIADVTYLPTELLDILHYSERGSVLGGSNFGLKYYSSVLILMLMRIMLLTAAGWFFYRCDGDIQAFLLPEHNAETVPTITA